MVPTASRRTRGFGRWADARSGGAQTSSRQAPARTVAVTPPWAPRERPSTSSGQPLGAETSTRRPEASRMPGCGTWVPLGSRCRMPALARRQRVDLDLDPPVAGVAARHEVRAPRYWPVAITTVVARALEQGRPSTVHGHRRPAVPRTEAVGRRPEHDGVHREEARATVPVGRRHRPRSRRGAARSCLRVQPPTTPTARPTSLALAGSSATSAPGCAPTASARSASVPATSTSAGPAAALSPRRRRAASHRRQARGDDPAVARRGGFARAAPCRWASGATSPI